jgi:hypothetical protein
MARWWWLEPGNEKARCKGTTHDNGVPKHRCKGMARLDGFCRVHAKRIILDRPEDVIELLKSEELREEVQAELDAALGLALPALLTSVSRAVERRLKASRAPTKPSSRRR